MKVLEAIATAISGHTAYATPLDVPMERQQELVRAANAALVDLYDLAPAVYEHTQVTQAIGATVAVTGLSIPAQGTTTASGSFAAAYRGQTVVLGGDPQYNEIATTDSVIYPNAGTAAATTATIYVDSFCVFDFSVKEVVGMVMCRRQSDGAEWPLVRDDRGWWASLEGDGNHNRDRVARRFGSERIRRIDGKPETYSVRTFGQSRNTDSAAAFALRVDPIPNVLHTLILKVAQSPAMLTLEEILDGAVLPMPEARAHGYYVDLLADRMSESSLWTSDAARTGRVQLRADRVRDSLRKLPEFFAPSMVRCGPPPGF